jgi:hypothetical protein
MKDSRHDHMSQPTQSDAPTMNNRNHFRTVTIAGFAAALILTQVTTSPAYPVGRVDFSDHAPFAGGYAPSLTATTADSLFTVSGWADLEATVPANLWNWWELLGVDSGVGNGALLDGTEAITIQINPSVGVAMMFFRYGEANGSGAGDLVQVNISGFTADPGTSVVPTGGQANRISNLTYANGTLSFDYLDDNGGNDAGQLIFSNPAGSAGCNLKVTTGASPNGNATSAGIALTGLDIQEAFGGPQIHPSQIAENTSNTHATPDGLLTVRGFSDLDATTPANLGRYLDECFGLAGPSTVSGNSSVTLQFASSAALVRLDSRYSGNTLAISGFLSDPGLADPSGGATFSSYADGTLTITVAGGGNHPFFFTNRAASAGQTLKLTSSGQFGIGGIGYDRVPLVMATDITPNVSPTFVSADGQLTITGYADTPGTVPVSINRNVVWFGVSGGNNNESTEGAESLGLQFAANVGLSGLGMRYTSGQVVISGFTDDPGFTDPSGIATGVSYAAGTLTYTFNAAGSPEIVVGFSNPAASAGQTLSLHTDGDPGSQLTLTRINYATSGVAPVTLAITKSGNDVTLTWPVGILQSSTNAAAFYEDVNGAVSPHTIPATDAQRFFRVKVQ